VSESVGDGDSETRGAMSEVSAGELAAGFGALSSLLNLLKTLESRKCGVDF
jgi:hypothetical protein